MNRLSHLRPTAVDVVLALALTAVSQAEIWVPGPMPGVGEIDGSRPFLAATTLLMTLPLALRRRLPLSVLVVVLGSAAAQQLVSQPNEGLSTLAACLIAAYSASAYAEGRRVAIGAVVVVLGSSMIGDDVSDHMFIAIVLGSAWLTGFVVGQRSQQVARLHDDNRDLHERLTEAAAALASAERRTSGEDSAEPEGMPGLTAREVEVARAIAQGMSNAEIAAHLVISEWTVKTHVASILRKLELRDRAQVVVAAYESGLVRRGDS